MGAPNFNPATLAPGCGHTPEPLVVAASAHRAARLASIAGGGAVAVAAPAWAGGARTGDAAVHALAAASSTGSGNSGGSASHLLRVTAVGPPAGRA